MVYRNTTTNAGYSPATVTHAPVALDEEQRALKQILHLFARRYGNEAAQSLGFWLIEKFSSGENHPIKHE